MIPKVSDLGISRDVHENEYYKIQDTSLELPVRWMSPESLTDFIFTTKSDVVQKIFQSTKLFIY